jgi:hypothetical protein
LMVQLTMTPISIHSDQKKSNPRFECSKIELEFIKNHTWYNQDQDPPQHCCIYFCRDSCVRRITPLRRELCSHGNGKGYNPSSFILDSGIISWGYCIASTSSLFFHYVPFNQHT